MKYYVLSMRGCKPRYYSPDDKANALRTYHYMRKHFAGVSLTRARWQKVVKDYIVTGRTA